MFSDYISDLIAPTLGFLLPAAWIAYKLHWLEKISKYYNSKINDKYGIVIPAVLCLVLPFIFMYLSNFEIPEIIKIILPIATFALGQSFQFNRDVKQKEKAWLFYMEDELLEVLQGMKQHKDMLQVEINLITNDRLEDLAQIELQPLKTLISWDSYKIIAPIYAEEKIIYTIESLTRDIQIYNLFIEQRCNSIKKDKTLINISDSFYNCHSKIYSHIKKIAGKIYFLSKDLNLEGVNLSALRLNHEFESEPY